MARIPVVLDGFISGSAALVAVALEPGLGPRLIAGHRSSEPGHRIVLDHLGLDPDPRPGPPPRRGVRRGAGDGRDRRRRGDPRRDGHVRLGGDRRAVVTTIVFVRHAATSWTGVRYCGRSDPSLSEDGRRAAEELAIRLAPVAAGRGPDRHQPQPSSARDGHDPGHAGGTGRPRGGRAMAGGGRRRLRRIDLRRGRGGVAGVRGTTGGRRGRHRLAGRRDCERAPERG